MRSQRHLAVRVLYFVLLVLAKVGAVQVLQTSEKGRLTQFVERIEPFVRRKLIRLKWFPPLLLAVQTSNSPNVAVSQYFSRRVFLLPPVSHGLLATALRLKSQELADATMKPFRFLKRPGSPWEMSPSLSGHDNWTHETNVLLERMHIASGTKIVLLAVRDATYYKALHEQQGETAGPETAPDTYIRNPNLETYSLAVDWLQERGYSVVYFGFPTSPLPPSLFGKVVDYSGQFRSPRGDLLLGRYCTMLMSGGSGAWALASLFNKPVAFSNSYFPFVGGYSERDRSIFQMIYKTRQGNEMTFREMIQTNGTYSYQSNCDRDGMRLQKNSPEEIGELALEVLDRRLGQFLSQPGDDELVRRFTAIQAEQQPLNGGVSMMATTFLRRYSHLLD